MIILLYRMMNIQNSKYLTEDELSEVKKAFQIFDQDHSGTITSDELDHILKSLGQYLEKQQLNELVEAIDLDKNGLIDFEQFLAIVTDKILSNRTDVVFIQTFKMLDFDGDGLIKEEQLIKAMQYLPQQLTSQEIRQIIEYCQPEGITLDTFLKLMLRRF